jgi:hypothetical protein
MARLQRIGVDELHKNSMPCLIDRCRDWEAVLVQNLAETLATWDSREA